ERASEASNICPRKKITQSPVVCYSSVTSAISSYVSLEDPAGCTAHRQKHIGGERTVEMSGQPDLKARRQIHIAAKGNLVSAIQGIGANIAVGIGKIGSGCAEIVVSRGCHISRKGIGNLQVCMPNRRKRPCNILLQGCLQRVVDGTPNGEQHLVGAHRIIDTGKSRRCARGTTAQHVT